MKHLITLMVTCLVTSVSFAQDLTVATFNCEFLIFKRVHIKYGLKYNITDEPQAVQDQWNSPGFREGKFDEACKKVAAHIKTINADIIGLTEVGGEEDVKVLREKLANLNADYPHVEICKSSDRTGQHVVLMSRYPLTNLKPKISGRALYFTEADLDDTADTGISKGMSATADVNGKMIEVFLLHFVSERAGHESDEQRVAQAEIVRRQLIPLVNEPEKLVLVMGDLNSERRHKSLLRLRGFHDIYPELLQTGDNYYFKDLSTRWTYSFMGNNEQIDHILMSNSLSKLCPRNNRRENKWGITSRIIETTDEFISDHNALLVDFDFKGE